MRSISVAKKKNRLGFPVLERSVQNLGMEKTVRCSYVIDTLIVYTYIINYYIINDIIIYIHLIKNNYNIFIEKINKKIKK